MSFPPPLLWRDSYRHPMELDLIMTCGRIAQLLGFFIALTLLSHAVPPAPVFAEDITFAFVRRSGAELRAEPREYAQVVAKLDRGEAIRITGDAKTASGETKPVTVATLGTTRIWFVPVEVLETGETGWIRQTHIDPNHLNEVPPTPPPPTPEPVGAVNQAKALLEPGCDDSIGITYTLEQEQNAVDDNDLYEFWDDHEACNRSVEIPIPSMLAKCSLPIEGVKNNATIIACWISVYNPEEGDAVMLSAEDFFLHDNDSRFNADLEVSKRIDPIYNIASQPVKVPAGQGAEAVVAFDVPSEEAEEDMILVWTAFGELTTQKADLPGFVIIVEDREPRVAEAILPVEPAAGPEGQGTATSGSAAPSAGNVYQGTSDDVIGPLELDPGLYQVSVRYAGDENFTVWARHADGSGALLVNEIGSYSGDTTFTVESSGRVVVEVKGVGSWSVQIEKLM